MQTRNVGVRIMTAALAVAMLGGAERAAAATIIKANNNNNLNLPSAWVGGIVPGSNDVAQWDSTVTAANTVVLSADTSWAGIRVLNPSGTAQINAGNTLTLGSQGVDMSSAGQSLTLYCPVTLGADQTWSATSKQFSPYGPVDLGVQTLTLVPASKIQFKNTITGSGTIVVLSGANQVQFSNGTTATNATVDFTSGGNLLFDSASGLASNGYPRARNARLDGGTLSVKGYNLYNSTDTVANVLLVNTRLSTVSVTPDAARFAQLRAGSFVRNPGAIALLAGTGLGMNPISSAPANSANIWFDTAPALLGAGGAAGTTTNSILAGIIGDTLVAGNGLDATGGLVTYDPVNGVRLLDPATEYTTAIADGQSQLDNVRLSNLTGIVQTNTLNAFTTINSLSCIVTGNVSVTNCGITVNGTGALRLNSGTLYVVQTAVATNTGNAITLNCPVLDLNGQEGLIFFRKVQQNSQIGSGGLLLLNSAITNGNGLTIYANSEPVDFGGSTTNTYSGMTTVNGGNVRLYKKVSNVAIPGDLTINAGNVYTGYGNQIRDSASITINGGSLQFANNSGSGSGTSETFSNLTMTGGSLEYQSGQGQTVGMLGSATIIGATTCAGPIKGNVFVVNTVTLTNGGKWSVNRANTANNSFESVTSFSNGVTMYQPASGVYTSITIAAGSGASINGGKLVLGGNLAVVGSSANTNTVVIGAPAGLGSTGVIALNGTRLFDIGNGAADVDLTVIPALTNGAIVGGLTKVGAGTLAFNAPTNNAYSGLTTVSNGTLLVNCGSISPVTVCSGATLSGTGYITTNTTALTVNAGGTVAPGSVGTIGTLSVTGDVAFVDGSTLCVDLGAGNASDLLAVAGNVTGNGTVLVSATTTNKGSWLVLSSTGTIAPSFTTDLSGYSVVKKNGNTEVWLMAPTGTAVFVR